MRPIPVEKLRLPEPGLYRVNEVFYSLQGEGVLAGTPMVFLRFSQCNLRCTIATVGFDCDTEFESGVVLTLEQVLQRVQAENPYGAEWVLFTGGEPALQVDTPLITALHDAGYRLAIETNGTIKLPDGLDWICVSPKTAEHTLRQRYANEVKYVRAYGQALPEPSIQAEHYLISPAFQPDGTVKREDLEWCIRLVLENPRWRLTMQQHKIWGVR